MKRSIILCLLLASTISFARAQQDYKSLLGTFYQHSENGFKDIIGVQTDTLSNFYPSVLTADIGEVQIGKFPYAVTLNWAVPLAQSSEVRAAVQDFMKATYSDDKLYKTVSDGTEEEGDMYTNVYVLGGAKPLLIFQTIYYRNEYDAEKSKFVMTMYGK